VTDDQEKRWRLLTVQLHELQQLQAGRWPAWTAHFPHASHHLSLDRRRTYADWCLRSLLTLLLPVVPAPLRGTVQACLALRDLLWSQAYMDAYSDALSAQETASPSCFPALDSR